MTTDQVSRRFVLAVGTSLCAAVGTRLVAAEEAPTIKVHRDPSCGCCGAWVAHLRASGFTADVIETDAIAQVKSRLGVPDFLASCHTAEINRYVIEGHVPAAAIRRLLIERPLGKGIAVPGMPVGSPGMEVEGSAPETYSVILFGPSGQRTFARYHGADEI